MVLLIFNKYRYFLSTDVFFVPWFNSGRQTCSLYRHNLTTTSHTKYLLVKDKFTVRVWLASPLFPGLAPPKRARKFSLRRTPAGNRLVGWQFKEAASCFGLLVVPLAYVGCGIVDIVLAAGQILPQLQEKRFEFGILDTLCCGTQAPEHLNTVFPPFMPAPRGVPPSLPVSALSGESCLHLLQVESHLHHLCLVQGESRLHLVRLGASSLPTSGSREALPIPAPRGALLTPTLACGEPCLFLFQGESCLCPLLLLEEPCIGL